LLTAWARLRSAVAGQSGESYGWIWDREGETFGREACQRLLREDLLPAFERAARELPQPYDVDRLLALVWIHSPEGQPMHRLRLDFPMGQMEGAKQKIADQLLALTPMDLRRGAQIGFVLSNVVDVALYGFHGGMTTVRKMDS
jgi:hypothetical protein